MQLDVIWGADAIAAAIGRSRRATFSLLEGGHLPARKVGGKWCTSRAALAAALAVPHLPEPTAAPQPSPAPAPEARPRRGARVR